jgi:hypothetical protein
MRLQGRDGKGETLGIESLESKFGARSRGTKTVAAILVCLSLVLGTACVGEPASGGQGSSGGGSEKSAASEGAPKETSASSGESTGSEKPAVQRTDSEEAELARAEVGKKEITNMIPADGKKPDRARPLPEDPSEGIEVYPATTNKTVEGPIEYDRRPPTNGDHAPIWQNCGFYERPVADRHAVHSLDHGVVWITYRPDLPADQVHELRPYGEEDYVIASPFPGQDAPVIATSWRVQLELDGTGDPRLRKFVDQFRISEIAPLSGNRCVGGLGKPAA